MAEGGVTAPEKIPGSPSDFSFSLTGRITMIPSTEKEEKR